MNIHISDPVLAAIEEARNRRDQADRDIRILLAYARELTKPRPYRLADLAAVAGMSVSGVRTAYTQQDIETAQRILRAASDGRPQDHNHSGQQRELPA
jgi:AraC-like DNA-binding protein